MPLLVQAVLGALGVHGAAVQHARLTDGKIGDVDHLLHFALPLGDDLAVFERDQFAELALVAPKLIAEQAHELAALRSGTSAQARAASTALFMICVIAGSAAGGARAPSRRPSTGIEALEARRAAAALSRSAGNVEMLQQGADVAPWPSAQPARARWRTRRPAATRRRRRLSLLPPAAR